MANRIPIAHPIFSDTGIVCRSEQETRRAASELAGCVKAGTVLSLDGPLGAGKTCFAKGLAAGLDIPPDDVASPTFPLVHEYAGGRLPLVHMDLYRIESIEELDGLGIDDYLNAEAVTLVEWGGKFPTIFPAGTWKLDFAIEGDARRIRAEVIG